ncbi:MAG: PEGA domain-containing protein, partial [Candidatus Caldatribacterium sp.]|nr:PEGA domain-containing protein [Candidatus Caldatribacterium sp.]
VNGERKGTVRFETPLVLQLPLGHHDVEIVSPCCLPERRRVSLAKAGEVAAIQATLVEPEPARLRLTVTPQDAVVTIGGRQLSAKELQEGIVLSATQTHEVKVVREGYETSSFTLTPTPGEEIRKSVTLKVARGVLVVRSVPSGANGWGNGKEQGVTPLEIQDLDPAKSFRVVVRHEHFQPLTKVVSFPPGELRQILEEPLVPADAQGKTLLAQAEGKEQGTPGAAASPPDHGMARAATKEEGSGESSEKRLVLLAGHPGKRGDEKQGLGKGETQEERKAEVAAKGTLPRVHGGEEKRGSLPDRGVKAEKAQEEDKKGKEQRGVQGKEGEKPKAQGKEPLPKQKDSPPAEDRHASAKAKGAGEGRPVPPEGARKAGGGPERGDPGKGVGKGATAERPLAEAQGQGSKEARQGKASGGTQGQANGKAKPCT